MSNTTSSDWLGTATITPDTPVVAGSTGTWTIDYTVGRSALDDGGRLRIATRTVTDHAMPQFNRPDAQDYVSVSSTGTATLTPVFEVAGVRPWSKALTIRVSDGQLAEGDQIRVILGDPAYGSPGMRAQTYPERDFTLKVLVDPFGTGIYEHVADVGYEIIGGAATQLVVTAPSDVVAGQDSWLHIRALDLWGNPDPVYAGTVQFETPAPFGLPEYVQFTGSEGGVQRFEGVRYFGESPIVVTVTDGIRSISGESNPIRLHADPPEHRVFWGDLHGQTRETVGTGSIEDYFLYGRDVAALDACAHSGNDFQITAEVYQELRDNSERFHEPGHFVTFHGYEWSGNTRAGGDHNVYYLDDGPLRRSSHTEVDDKSDVDTDCYPIDRLYAANSDRDDVLITPHIGGRRADLAYHDPALEPAIEIASQWGRFEWFAREALERGMKVGFIGGSDDHSGRPGWSAPTLAHHGVRGGLTAYLAPELTREGIWDALRSRRVYGTSGPRILLDVTVNGQPMGSELTVDRAPRINMTVNGTAPLDTIELRRGLETIHTESVLPEPGPDEPWRVRLAWRGARNRDRSRALDWSGGVQISGGMILAAENHATDSPLDGVFFQDSERVLWKSHTCGDWDGVILDIDGDADTSVRFRTPTMSFSFRLADLAGGGIRRDGQLLEQQVTVRRLARRDGPRTVRFDMEDTTSGEGLHPYWIWVTQADGEMAWSSPIFVTVE
jgi:hypothetical protein